MTEQPPWRKGDKKTKDLVSEILHYQTKYAQLPEKAKKFCEKDFAPVMAVDYIYNLNIGELVGTQTEEETREVIERLSLARQSSTSSTKESIDSLSEKKHKETMNTYDALDKFHRVRGEMEQSGLLTVQLICEVHRTLMEGLHDKAGKIRETVVHTTYQDKLHFYPPPEKVETRLYALVDRHNIYVEGSPTDNQSVEYILHVFKMAARLMFEFVDTHPFGDGNGRMCRLLANYAISHITPFPVGVYHSKNPDRSGRDDYIQAIVSCRDNPAVGPGDLAAMLIDSAYWGWKNLFYNLERREELQPGIVLGPVVLQKSKPDKVAERVQRILPSLLKEGVQVDEATVVRQAEAATQEANVSQSNPLVPDIRTIAINGSTKLKLEVYP